MSFLADLRKRRKKLADVLSDEEYSGIRQIVEDLYPDRAHFIYELLQNAEDTGATEAAFILNEQSLVFEHNGRSFDEMDVEAITNIGKGTKADQEDQIGRFGIGFKAVFAYSETPRIWSPTYSFEISDLVLPTEMKKDPNLGQKTHFEFPFNNSKKSAMDAYQEIEMGLREFAEATLLFLSSLESIRWDIMDPKNRTRKRAKIRYNQSYEKTLYRHPESPNRAGNLEGRTDDFPDRLGAWDSPNPTQEVESASSGRPAQSVQ